MLHLVWEIHTVVPAKVTTAPVCRLCRSIVLDGGAEILLSTMFVHDATAEEMEAYAVTVQVDPPPTAEAIVDLIGRDTEMP